MASLIAMALALAACSDEEGGSKVYDAIVVAADKLLKKIDEDDSFKKQVDTGTEINGTLEEGGGKLGVSGWRIKSSYENGAGLHTVFGERLVLKLTSFAQSDLTLDGDVVLTRHNFDIGPAGGVLDAASRMTVYRGAVRSNGAASGNFDLEVHVFVSGTTTWACGYVNDEPQGLGNCY